MTPDEPTPGGGVREKAAPSAAQAPDVRLVVGGALFAVGLLLFLIYSATCTGAACVFPAYFWLVEGVPLIIGALLLALSFRDQAERDRSKVEV